MNIQKALSRTTRLNEDTFQNGGTVDTATRSANLVDTSVDNKGRAEVLDKFDKMIDVKPRGKDDSKARRLGELLHSLSPVDGNSPLIVRRPTVDPARPYIPVPLVLGSHPEFSNQYPPILGNVKIVRPVNGYEHKIRRDHANMLRVGTDMSVDQLNRTQSLFNQVVAFEGILTEADIVTGISGLTSDMSGKHSDIEEHGIGSLSEEGRSVKDKTVRIACTIMKRAYEQARKLGAFEKVSTKIPLFTLPGFPYQGRGGSLVSASFTLAFVKIAQQALSKNYGIHELSRVFFAAFGDTKFYEIYRRQASNKVIPETETGGGLRYTVNFIKRMRAVFPGSKAYLAMVRKIVKELTEAIFLFPTIVRSPAEAVAAIDEFGKLEKKGDKILGMRRIPADASKADKRQGLARAKVTSEIFAFPTGLPHDTFYQELDFPFIQKRGSELVQIGKGGQLASGVSTTTIANMTNFGLLMVIEILDDLLGMTEDEIISAFTSKFKKSLDDEGVRPRIFEKNGKRFGVTSFGDDLMMVTNLKKEDVFAVAQRINIELSEEPTLRFIGFDFGGGSVDTFHRGRNLGNMISKTLSPERMKIFPYTAIGHLGRFYALDEGIRKDYHESMKDLFPAHIGMDWTSIENMETQMKDVWLPQVLENSSRISMLYDALASFTHGGIDAAESSLLPGALEVFAEEEIIGKFTFDPEDIDGEIGRLSELHGFDSDVGRILRGISSHTNTWNRSITDLARLHSLIWESGGPVY
jgi:hypothetical protein